MDMAHVSRGGAAVAEAQDCSISGAPIEDEIKIQVLTPKRNGRNSGCKRRVISLAGTFLVVHCA